MEEVLSIKVDGIGGGAVYAVQAMAYTHFTQCVPGIALAYTL